MSYVNLDPLERRLPDDRTPAPGRHEFTVPNFRPATIDELTKRGDYRSAAGLKRWDRQFVADAALIRRIPKATRKRRVSAEVTMAGRMRPVDPGACLWSLLDALVAAGLLVDDSPRWVEIGSFVQIRGALKATKIVLVDLLEDTEDA